MFCKGNKRGGDNKIDKVIICHVQPSRFTEVFASLQQVLYLIMKVVHPGRGSAIALRLLQYMPSKPAKYGIKIFRMCDARVPYAIDGMIYTGRQPGEEVQRNILLKLLEKNLTIVGTLCKNKPDIPPVMKPSKSREKQSSEFGFSGNMTMVSYVPKKGKAVVLLSTMHDDRAVDDNSVKKKPEVIQYYNQTKSGVDTMDQRRWPMVLWHNVPDVATLNAYTNFTAQHPDYMGGVTNARRLFIKELGKELIMPHMKRRMEGTPQLQTHITEAMGRCGLRKINAATTQPQENIRQEGQVKRKRCKICPAAKDRKASSWCSKCTSPVCKEHKHVIVICEACMH